jgi:predicted transcriptional regulator
MTAEKFTGHHIHLGKEGALVGILPQKHIRERILAIARGDVKPKATDPKICFTSLASLNKVLSNKDQFVR